MAHTFGRGCLGALSVVILLFFHARAHAYARESPTVPPAATAASSVEVLVLTERGGQHEGFAATALAWLDSLAARENYTLTVINDTRPITADYLARFRVFVQLDFPPYTWGEGSKRAFEAYIDRGLGGWVGFHHATLLGDFDGWPMWEWFSDFMGGVRFKNYIRETADGTLHVEAPAHPVMRGVGPVFTLPADEWYTFDRSPRPDVEVLASVDEGSYTPASTIRMGDHPAVWCNPAKRARNVYFLFGHSGRLFEVPEFRTMFENAIQWSAGRVPDATQK